MKRRRRRKFNGCGDKIRFATADEASAENPGQWTYPCTSCGCWHLTTLRVA